MSAKEFGRETWVVCDVIPVQCCLQGGYGRGKRLAWQNSTICSGLADGCIALAWCSVSCAEFAAGIGCSGGKAGGGSGLVFKYHNGDVFDRVPCRIVLPSRWILALSAVKMAVQPASQRTPMEMREPQARSENMWACLASGGRPGTFNSPVCVELMVSPLGMLTLIGLEVGLILMTGPWGSQKWAVHPVSAIVLDGVPDVATLADSLFSQTDSSS
jgi:hypothetical protein